MIYPLNSTASFLVSTWDVQYARFVPSFIPSQSEAELAESACLRRIVSEHVSRRAESCIWLQIVASHDARALV